MIRTEGDDDCFLTMGNHCSKGQASIQAAYHPDRIKYPMKRTNPKGDDDPGWTRISWDEAYQTIADNILEISDKYGRESTVHLVRYWPSMVHAVRRWYGARPISALPTLWPHTKSARARAISARALTMCKLGRGPR